MDKQKQIEEMANVMLVNMERPKCFTSATEEQEFMNAYKFAFLGYATYLYNAGYRKIPENAVVVSEQVWEEHIVNWDKASNALKERVRKETAEKFARLVEFHSVSTRDEEGREIFTISALGLKEILHEEFGIPYDEIAKEFTGGKV